jgi:hypothetical protein
MMTMKIEFVVELSKEELAEAAAYWVTKRSGYTVQASHIDVTKLNDCTCKVQCSVPSPGEIDDLFNLASNLRSDRKAPLADHDDKLDEQIEEANLKLVETQQYEL